MKNNSKFRGAVAGVMVTLASLGVGFGFSGCKAVTIDMPTQNDLNARYLELLGKISEYSGQTQTLEGSVSSYTPGADAAAKKAEFEGSRAGIAANVEKLSSDYAAVMTARLEYEIGLLKARLETLKGTIEGIAVARAIAAKQELIAAIRGLAGNIKGA
jgi:hypothetical protein